MPVAYPTPAQVHEAASTPWVRERYSEARDRVLERL